MSGREQGEPRPEQALTARRRQALERRAHLLEVASRLFAQHGFAGTSTRQIAREAGVAEGLLFHYFPGKAELFAASLERADSFPRQVVELVDGAEGRPAEEVLRELGARWVKTALSDGAMLATLVGESRHHPEAAAAMAQVSGGSVKRLAGYLSARVAVGELRADLPAETAATSFIAPLMVFLLMNQGLSAARWKKLAERHVEEVLSLWMQGARSPEPARSRRKGAQR